MFIKYFFYSSAAVLLSILLIAGGLLGYIRLKHLQKLAVINVLRRRQKQHGNLFFSTHLIKQTVKKLYLSPNKKSLFSLTCLAGGRLSPAIEYFKKTAPEISLLLQACENSPATYRKILRQTKLLKKTDFCLHAAWLACLNFDFKNFTRLLAKINIKHLSFRDKGLFYYLTARAYLQEADMMSASQNASLALDIFKKYAYTYEEAKCYLLLAEIYRISCVNDIAQTMIESALKIYQARKLPYFEAQATTVLGMLMLYENRLEEAEDKYNKALSLIPTSLTSAEIINQFALLELARKENDTARRHAEKACRMHTRFQNKRGQAFSRQLLGHICFNKGDFGKAATHARMAAQLYDEQENASARAECLYLEASALCKLHQDEKAEPLLRKILDYCAQKSLNFHTANAYSLLGLIYLRSRDLQRAKVLFQQSLHLEQSNERCPGLAADYANLALIESQTGNAGAARSNLEIALEYAQKTQDEELIKLISEKIPPASNN